MPVIYIIFYSYIQTLITAQGRNNNRLISMGPYLKLVCASVLSEDDAYDTGIEYANIVVHGLQENADNEERMNDENLIKTIFDVIGIHHTPKSIIRLGKSQQQRTRPVKIVMKLKTEKNNVVSKLSNLKNAEDKIKKIRITDDYTLKERREIGEWIEKAKEKTQQESGQYVWKVRGTPKNGMRLAKFRTTRRPTTT